VGKAEPTSSQKADIAGARQAGLPTILVLSGVTAQEDLGGAAIGPDLVLGGGAP
jgi:ribonucleotide monophosphatase NagD (HAD superfamily)